MEESKYKKINEYNKDHYFKLAIRIPKDKRDELDKLAKKLDKSINSIFIEAVETQYGIDITSSNKAKKLKDASIKDSFLMKKLKIMGELGVPNMNNVQRYIEYRTNDIVNIVEYCDEVSALASFILNCYYDESLDRVLSE